MWMRVLKAFLLLLLGGEAAAQASSELRGRVVSDSGVPIRGATITLAAVGYSVRTDSLGLFSLTGTPGSTVSLSLRAEGFRDDTASVVLERGRVVRRDFTLVAESTPLPEANPSERVLRGQVTDPEGAPLAYANVQINGGRRYISDDSGRFTMPITVSGGFMLLFRRIGFNPEEMKLDSVPTAVLRVRMSPAAAALPEMRVIASSPFASLNIYGFYRRMADVERGINRGYFITPEELQTRNPFMVTSAVEHLPNIRIRPAPLPLVAGPKPPLNLRIEDGRGCPLTVYVDRVKVSPVLSRGAMRDEHINTLLVPTTLAGVEVYPRRAGAPPEFALSDGTCGVVLIWTK